MPLVTRLTRCLLLRPQRLNPSSLVRSLLQPHWLPPASQLKANPKASLKARRHTLRMPLNTRRIQHMLLRPRRIHLSSRARCRLQLSRRGLLKPRVLQPSRHRCILLNRLLRCLLRARRHTPPWPHTLRALHLYRGRCSLLNPPRSLSTVLRKQTLPACHLPPFQVTVPSPWVLLACHPPPLQLTVSSQWEALACHLHPLQVTNPS